MSNLWGWAKEQGLITGGMEDMTSQWNTAEWKLKLIMAIKQDDAFRIELQKALGIYEQ